jgi:hypothetical protein
MRKFLVFHEVINYEFPQVSPQQPRNPCCLGNKTLCYLKTMKCFYIKRVIIIT